jgi:immunity protein, SdpI family
MGRHSLRWAPGLVIVVTILYTLSVYPDLPARMPTHWGVSGQPTGWSPREFGAWFLPGLMVFLWGVFLVLPSIDPKRANYDKFGTAYHILALAAVTFEGIVQWAILNVALGHGVDLNTIVYVGLGAMFAIAGIVSIIAALTLPPSGRFLAVITASLAALGAIGLSYYYWRHR